MDYFLYMEWYFDSPFQIALQKAFGDKIAKLKHLRNLLISALALNVCFNLTCVNIK